MSLPLPEPGLVINYAYLWHSEASAGTEEGRKDRPSTTILMEVSEINGVCEVTVLPITHSPPRMAGAAIEIPHALKSHLGLDSTPSWIVVVECNEFNWSGYDLRKRSKTGGHEFGFMPPRFFDRVREAFLAARAAGNVQATERN